MDKEKSRIAEGIKALPEAERPREKLLQLGPERLSTAELLALLLATGNRGQSALDLAQRLLSLSPEGLSYLAGCGEEELVRLEGVGPAKAARVMAALELGKRLSAVPRSRRVSVGDPGAVASIFMPELRYQPKEIFKALLLNRKNEIIAAENISVGTLSSSPVHPREVFCSAVKKSAAAVILVHNHPSGDPEPSDNDLLVSRRLWEAGRLLGIDVLDHVIIGDGCFVSLSERGMLSFS